MRVRSSLVLGLSFALAGAAAAQQQGGGGPQKATVAVAPFTFHTGIAAPPGAELETSQLTQKFVTALVNTRKFDVVERSRVDTLINEMQMGQAGLMDPARAVEAGKTLGADYFLMGEISVFTLTTTVKPIPNTQRFSRQEDLRLILDMRIVDTRTSKIVSAEKGESLKSARQMFNGQPPVNSPVDPAALDAIQREVVDQVLVKVIDAIYPIKVIAVNQDGVSINRGEGGGVAVGDQFDVFSEGEQMVDPDTGEVLGSEETKVGRIRITQVLPRFSKCALVAGAPAVGNICRKASGAAPTAAPPPPPPPPPPPRDTQAPTITVLAPKEGATVNTNPINVVVSASDNVGVTRVTIAGAEAQRDDKGNYRGQVRGNEGGNRVRIEAFDAAGNKGEAQVTFTFDSTPPQVQANAQLLVEGTVSDLTCTLTINGQAVQYDKQTGRYSVRVTPDPKNPGVVTIVATDEYGNQTVETRNVR